jgi:hypothetical protein
MWSLVPVLVVAVVVFAIIIASANTPATTPTAAQPTASQSPSPTPTDDPSATPTDGADQSGGVSVVIASGAILPNRARTPGAVNPAVTESDIGSTICKSGWTSTIRPPSSVTTALKKHQLATGYAYKGDMKTKDYEEDHLISLELGGAPASAANLWPEPYNVTDGARVKDRIENKLHSLVCAHTLTLAAAQQAIATNWWTAYQKYVG